jgi:parallel beta-helix repeat protein
MTSLTLTLLLLVILTFTLSPALSAPEGKVLTVSPTGNDRWSGTLPQPNAARTDGPWASLTRARDGIRALRAAGDRGPVTVQLRGGRYYLDQPLTLGPEDSGSPAGPVRYVAYPGETPEIIGGRQVTGFKPWRGAILQADLKGTSLENANFRQLFVNNERQIRARTPNVDPTDPVRKGFFYVARGKGGFGVSVGNIHNAGDWMEYRLPVPVDGEYRVWTFYGALNKPHGNENMAGRTSLKVNDETPVLLDNLPDTGGWGLMKWTPNATLKLTAGTHTLRWENHKGGGLNLEAFAFTTDPNWKPTDTKLPPVAAGQHLILKQAEDFARYNGKQLSVGGTGGSKTEFYYAEGDIKPQWAQAPGAEVHIFQSGSCRAYKEILTIEAVDPETAAITVGGPEATAGLGYGDRYFVENILSELDSPGEWYLDREAKVLYYWPRPGFSDQAEVIAPITGRLVEIIGNAAQQQEVTDLRFEGLIFRHGDYEQSDGCIGYGMGHNGALYLKDARRCVIQRCRFLGTGKYGVALTGGGEHQISQCEVADSAEGGILITSSAGNSVTDCHIHHCGAVYKHIGGVVITGPGSDDNRIAHNLLHDFSRYGISIKMGGLRNLIEFNHVARTNHETFDTGAIEVTQHNREQLSHSVIRNNVVADTIGWYAQGPKVDVYMAWSIYLDSFAGGYEVRDNVCYRSSHGGIMLQGGKGNQVINNILLEGSHGQGHLSNFADNSRGQVLERNIFAWTNPELTCFATGKLNEEVIQIDRNLYWVPGGEVRMGWGRALSFAQWQEKGYDRNSLIADPLFVDPAKDNYALRPESPAFKLGFKAIDLSRVGPQEGPYAGQKP